MSLPFQGRQPLLGGEQLLHSLTNLHAEANHRLDNGTLDRCQDRCQPTLLTSGLLFDMPWPSFSSLTALASLSTAALASSSSPCGQDRNMTVVVKPAHPNQAN